MRCRSAVVAAVLALSGVTGTACAAGSARPASGGCAATAYVVNYYSGTVTPIDIATRTAGRPIRLPGGEKDFPADVAITPDGRTAYVTNTADDGNSVTPISTATNQPGRPIRASALPFLQTIAISPDGKTAYVLGGEVTVLSTATNQRIRTIRLQGPGTNQAIVLSRDGTAAYVINPSAVTPIDAAANTAGRPIPVSSGWDLALTPDGKTAYVTNWNQGTVTPISTASGQPGTPIKVGRLPGPITITPDGKTVYVANTTARTVTPISTATDRAGQPIKAGEMQARAVLAVSPDGKTLFVLGVQAVTMIGVATGRVDHSIPLRGALDIAFSPDGATAWITATNAGPGTVVPVSVRTGRAGHPIRVGQQPQAIAITPCPRAR